MDKPIRTLAELQAVAVDVIWPLLQDMESRLVKRFQNAIKAALVPPPMSSGPAAPGRSRVPIQFTAVIGNEGDFVGHVDGSFGILYARMLYRAYGGEHIKRYTLSCRAFEFTEQAAAKRPLGVSVPLVAIGLMKTKYLRQFATPFSPPISIPLFGNDIVTLDIDQVLEPGDCLVAVFLQTFAGPRVDGTVVIEVPNGS